MKEPGQTAYEAYGDARGWQVFNGDVMPTWSEQSIDLKVAWRAAERSGSARRHYYIHIDDLAERLGLPGTALRVWDEADTGLVHITVSDSSGYVVAKGGYVPVDEFSNLTPLPPVPEGIHQG